MVVESLPTQIQQNSFAPGDNVSGDKVEGDKVTGDKIIYEGASSLVAPSGSVHQWTSLASPIPSATADTSIVQPQEGKTCDSSEYMLGRLSISIYSLNQAYLDSSDEEREDFQKRKGLIVIDRGFVESMGTTTDGRMFLHLKQNKKDILPWWVTCYFDARWTQTVEALEIGQEINYCGKIYDFFVGVTLNECVLK